MSAFGSGLVGALYHLNALRILPAAVFDLSWLTAAIFIVVIGGIGSIIGTLIYLVLREMLADCGCAYWMALGAVAILVMVRYPKCLWGTLQHKHG